MPSLRSLYDVLNVAPEAEPVVVEAAYKALIKKYHPDQAVEAPVSKDAAEITEALALLKAPAERAASHPRLWAAERGGRGALGREPAKRADDGHRLWAKQRALRAAELQVHTGGRPPRFVAV